MNMRIIALSVVLLAATPVAVVSPGCSIFQKGSHPSEVYTDWNEFYILAVTNLIAAYDAGDISKDDWDNYYTPAILEADRLLDELKDAIDDPKSFDLTQQALRSVMNILEQKAGA